PAILPSTLATNESLPASNCGVCLVWAMYVFGTLSNHTVCHIPVTGVYHIPWGFLICFPLGCGPSSVGSHTRITISCFAPFLMNLVISIENELKPPSCLPTRLLFTYTSHCQSTAPK